MQGVVLVLGKIDWLVIISISYGRNDYWIILIKSYGKSWLIIDSGMWFCKIKKNTMLTVDGILSIFMPSPGKSKRNVSYVNWLKHIFSKKTTSENLVPNINSADMWWNWNWIFQVFISWEYYYSSLAY